MRSRLHSGATIASIVDVLREWRTYREWKPTELVAWQHPPCDASGRAHEGTDIEYRWRPEGPKVVLRPLGSARRHAALLEDVGYRLVGHDYERHFPPQRDPWSHFGRVLESIRWSHVVFNAQRRVVHGDLRFLSDIRFDCEHRRTPGRRVWVELSAPLPLDARRAILDELGPSYTPNTSPQGWTFVHRTMRTEAEVRTVRRELDRWMLRRRGR